MKMGQVVREEDDIRGEVVVLVSLFIFSSKLMSYYTITFLFLKKMKSSYA